MRAATPIASLLVNKMTHRATATDRRHFLAIEEVIPVALDLVGDLLRDPRVIEVARRMNQYDQDEDEFQIPLARLYNGAVSKWRIARSLHYRWDPPLGATSYAVCRIENGDTDPNDAERIKAILEEQLRKAPTIYGVRT